MKETQIVESTIIFLSSGEGCFGSVWQTDKGTLFAKINGHPEYCVKKEQGLWCVETYQGVTDILLGRPTE